MATLSVSCAGKEDEVDNDVEGDDTQAEGDDDAGSQPSLTDDDTGADDTSADDDTTDGTDITVADDDTAADDDAPAVPTVDMPPAVPTDMPPAVPPSGERLGAACEADEDCSADLFCYNQERPYFGGTYPNGVCTLPCADDPFLCPTGSQCLGDANEAYCAPECPSGDTGTPKCRADQMCWPSSAYVGVCDAWCRDDMDCPSGTACEVATGLCKEQPHEGIAVGEACTSNGECEGLLCIPWTEDATAGVCSAFCKLGDSNSLANCGGGVGVCDIITTLVITNPVVAPGAGDMGFCAPTCETDSDCLAEGLECIELTPEAAESVGSSGVCELEGLFTEPGEDAGAPVTPPAPSVDAGVQ